MRAGVQKFRDGDDLTKGTCIILITKCHQLPGHLICPMCAIGFSISSPAIELGRDLEGPIAFVIADPRLTLGGRQ